MQGSSVAGHLPVTTHGDQGALARVIESLAATQQRSGGLPVNTLADHRTNEVIGSLLRYRALLQPALTNTAETAQQLPPTMQTTYPTTMSENASLIQFWIQQQAAAQVSPQPNQLLGLLSGTLNNPALVRAAALSHPHRLPSFVLGNQRDANGIASIHQAREARQPSGMLSTARPSPGGLGIDSKAFSSIGPDGHPIDLPAILSLPEDHIKLSTHQVFLRHQIEAFRASVEDISTHTRGRNKPVTTGQIGIRCRHCAHIPVGQRQKGSTYFPATLLGLYQAAQNMSTTHMQCGLCLEMPNEIKQQFAHLISTKVASFGAGRPYWEKAAKKLGFVDTDNGIRFVRDQNISEQQRQNASSTEEQKT